MIYGDKAVKNLSNHEKFTLIKGDIRDKKNLMIVQRILMK